jgi:UDP-N-acetylmuramoyl-tripeptide--D-alanyl-D-alanine ligase
MAASFTIAEILSATRGTLLHPGAGDALAGVSTDSRTCQAGELFIPLSGERHDGHIFIPKALNRGAWGLLVAETVWRRGLPGHPGLFSAIPREVAVIGVQDTLTALGDLALAWRQRFTLPLVAITGSCGKTTTKEMIAQVVGRRFRVLKNHLNLNNLIGLPQTLLELSGDHEAAVVEMGMNRFGEILRLTSIASPTIGVLTNVHPAHTEGVGDVDGVGRAKGELVTALALNATLVYNADDPYVSREARRFKGRNIGFGLADGVALQATERRPRGRQGQAARINYRGQSWELSLPTPGLHMLYNALAASAVGLALGIKPQDADAALRDFAPIARRNQVVALKSGVQLLNDCYNANPGSMGMALRTLAELRDQGRAAAALGDMLELGQRAVDAHRDLGRQAAQAGLDFLVVYGKHRLDVAQGAMAAGLGSGRIFPVTDKADGARILKELLAPGDWLLVKGSRSMHMEALIDHLEE